MTTTRPHLNALFREIRHDQDAPAFLIGYLLADIPDELICASLAAWKRHQQELAELENDPGPLPSAAVYDPRD